MLYRPSETCANATSDILRGRLADELMLLCGMPRKLTVEEEIQSLRGALKEGTLNVLAKAITYSWFDQRKGDLREVFEEQLPGRLSHWLTPGILWTDDGERLWPLRLGFPDALLRDDLHAGLLLHFTISYGIARSWHYSKMR